MRWAKAISFVLSSVVVLCGATANADLLNNGGFETGDLTGWGFGGAGPFGPPGATNSEYSRDVYPPIAPDWTPRNGGYFASLWSTDKDPQDPTLISTLSQTFVTPGPGYALSFDYFFDFGDEAPFYDTAKATLRYSDGNMVLFEHNTIVGSPDENTLDDFANIDWNTVSAILPTPTTNDYTYTLEFTITDFDGKFESILGVDNVSVVPLPPALLLGGLGLGFAGSLLSRFRRNRAS
jgi:hypothetical protein